MPPVVLVDTNVWGSAIINPHGYPAKLIDAWINRQFEVIISLPLLEEISEILQRPRIKEKYSLTDTEIKTLLKLLAERARHVILTADLKVCRDPNDDLVLETAILGKAEYVVTRDDDIKGDSDLINKMRSRKITILTISHFLKRLKDREL